MSPGLGALMTSFSSWDRRDHPGPLSWSGTSRPEEVEIGSGSVSSEVRANSASDEDPCVQEPAEEMVASFFSFYLHASTVARQFRPFSPFHGPG